MTVGFERSIGRSAISNYSALSGFFTQLKLVDISSKICVRSLIDLVNSACLSVFMDYPAIKSDLWSELSRHSELSGIFTHFNKHKTAKKRHRSLETSFFIQMSESGFFTYFSIC